MFPKVEQSKPVAYLTTRQEADLESAGTCTVYDAQFAPGGVAAKALTFLTHTFQTRVAPWMIETFGPFISNDKMERNHRFFEEATELVQACGMTASEAHQLVDYTFGRPAGEPSQEVGGVMVTLAAHCLAHGIDMHDAGETELARIWTKSDVIRAKQAAKPPHSPLPEAAKAFVSLEGLADRLLAPRDMTRDKEGHLYHPDYPICDEGTNAETFLAAFGLESAFIGMESDDPDRYDAISNGNDDVNFAVFLSSWAPEAPDGAGWVLLEVYDTENGPYAMFARKQPKVPTPSRRRAPATQAALV